VLRRLPAAAGHAATGMLLGVLALFFAPILSPRFAACFASSLLRGSLFGFWIFPESSFSSGNFLCVARGALRENVVSGEKRGEGERGWEADGGTGWETRGT